MIGLKKDSSGIDLLLHLKEEFNDCAFNSEQVSPSLAYLHSSQLKQSIDAQIFKNFESNEVIDKFKNYKDLDLDNNVEKEIYDICCKLEETGEYEEFISRLEDDMKK